LENKKYYCLFCGEDGPRWDTPEELFDHMKNTVHRVNGGIAFFTGDNT
jgi:hypothetical protein